ncbi:MAG: hydroxyacid dehydrogenase [Chloroflexota bacterium]
MHNALFLLNTDAYDKIYGPEERADLHKLVNIYAPQQTAASVQADPSILSQAEIILSGWGMPKLDAEFLAQVPNLKAVFYGAGTIRYFTTDVFWKRNIPVTSAYAMNAVPVAEFTISQIFFSLKLGWRYVMALKEAKRYVPRFVVPGSYKSTVGIISLGMIGRRVCELLQPFDVQILAYDPFVAQADVDHLNVDLCSLDDIFTRSDVVSLHTPWLPETVNMIRGTHLAAMKTDATFINTARGAIVHEQEMIAVLQQRPDLTAVIDVTYPEPPEPGSPLFTLPNVILTPHIAGSLDTECRRMGRLVVDEVGRFVQGEPLQWAISREKAALLA